MAKPGEGKSKEWFVLIKMKDPVRGYEHTRFGNVQADEPFTANEAWQFHRRKMTVEDIESVVEVYAIQIEHMAKITVLNTVGI